MAESFIHKNLAYLSRRGKVTQVGKGIGTKWRLAWMPMNQEIHN